MNALQFSAGMAGLSVGMVLHAVAQDERHGQTTVDAVPAAKRAIDSQAGSLPGTAPDETAVEHPRQLLRHPPIKLTFEKGRQILPLQISSRSPREQLVLQVTRLGELAPGARFRKDVPEARFDREVIVEFESLRGAEIALKLARTDDHPLVLVVASRFRESPTRDFELTFEQLERSRWQADRTHRQAQARITQLNDSLAGTRRQLRLTRQIPSRDVYQEQRKMIELVRLNTAIRDAQRHLESAQRQATSAQARLDAAPKVLTFLKSLDGSTLPFRVLDRSSGVEQVCVEGNSPAPAE
jgi:hypothetical protein